MKRVDAGDRLPVILSVAFPYAPVGPQAVGGAEVICTEVEAALPGMGFRSVVVAHAESRVVGQLYPTAVPEGVITDAVRAEVEARQQAAIDYACREQPVALVHMHGLDFTRYQIPERLPVVVTLHLPPAWYLETVWSLPERYTLVCVSESQRQACPEHARGRVRVIGNGVRLPEKATLRDAGRYALMLARICPEKNLHVGLDAARRAGMPVLLGGETFAYEAHQRYFAEEIAPRLTRSDAAHEGRGGGIDEEPGARFLGPVAGAEKARLLRRAGCVLLPSPAPETSSLVAMEALAAGVPVVAMRVGAVPEIVEDGRTGFLVDPSEGATEAMAEAIGRVPEIDRAVCRGVAEERFGLKGMLAAYAGLYREVLGRRRAVWPGAAVAEALVASPVLEEEALAALMPEWAALWARDGTATPFQHPAWLVPWWRQFGPDGRLAGAAVRGWTSGELAGFLPGYVYLEESSGKRVLLLAGAGTSDYLGGVFASAGTADTALRSVLAVAGWDAVRWQQLRAGSALLQAGEACGLATSGAEPCAVVDVRRELPAKLRVNLNRYGRLAGTVGAVQCRMAATGEEALADFEVLVRLHSVRWRERGEEGVLHDPRVLAHHRESLPLLVGAGLLRMFRLTIGGATAGVLYGLADGPGVRERRLYLYLIGFEARFGAVSPGSLLVRAAWEQARREGAAGLDLLRGGEGYKRHWGAVAEGTFALQRG